MNVPGLQTLHPADEHDRQLGPNVLAQLKQTRSDDAVQLDAANWLLVHAVHAVATENQFGSSFLIGMPSTNARSEAHKRPKEQRTTATIACDKGDRIHIQG